MSSREHPRTPLQSPTEAIPRAQTGTRAVAHAETLDGIGATSGRSGEYPVTDPIRQGLREPLAAREPEDRLTPSEPIATAGQPLPSLRRPFASLSQMPRPEMPSQSGLTPSEPPPSVAPSVRRPLSVGQQPRKLGNCQLHKVALSPHGQCVLCKREHDALVRSRWSIAAVFLIVGIAIAAGLVLAR